MAAHEERERNLHYQVVCFVTVHSIVLFQNIQGLWHIEGFHQFTPAVVFVSSAVIKRLLDYLEPVVSLVNVFSAHVAKEFPVGLLLRQGFLHLKFLSVSFLHRDSLLIRNEILGIDFLNFGAFFHFDSLILNRTTLVL